MAIGHKPVELSRFTEAEQKNLREANQVRRTDAGVEYVLVPVEVEDPADRQQEGFDPLVTDSSPFDVTDLDD